jgi:hypothetical protein
MKHGTTAYKNSRCRCRVCRAAATAAMREWASRAVDLDAQPHGVLGTYNNYGCRCEPCRAAKSANNRRRPSRAKAKAGTP